MLDRSSLRRLKRCARSAAPWSHSLWVEVLNEGPFKGVVGKCKICIHTKIYISIHCIFWGKCIFIFTQGCIGYKAEGPRAQQLGYWGVDSACSRRLEEAYETLAQKVEPPNMGMALNPFGLISGNTNRMYGVCKNYIYRNPGICGLHLYQVERTYKLGGSWGFSCVFGGEGVKFRIRDGDDHQYSMSHVTITE